MITLDELNVAVATAALDHNSEVWMETDDPRQPAFSLPGWALIELVKAVRLHTLTHEGK